MGIIKKILCALLAICGAGTLYTQQMVYLEHSDSLLFDEKRLPNIQILKGNVIFRHDSALMYCDSAYFFAASNSLHAFSNVRLHQGDSIRGYGDKLFYDGNTKMAKLRENVRLEHQTTTLLADSINYDRIENLAYFLNNGMILTQQDTLQSFYGQYFPPEHLATFKQNVVLHNPQMTLYTDTLCFNTETHIASLQDSTIIFCDTTTTIISTNGWYNTNTEKAMLLDASKIIHNNGITLIADTIFYDKTIGFGQLLQNISVVDSTQKITMYGQYGQMYKDVKEGFVTDSAYVVDWSGDEKSYIHADTFYTHTFNDTVIQQDTADSIANYSILQAYNNVRLFRKNEQAVCDSLVYNQKDSTITLYTLPLCWSENNQLSGDLITIFLKDSTIDYIHIKGNALIVQQYSQTQYNQLNSREIYAYIRNGELHHADAKGNAVTIFFPEDNHEVIGVNKTESSNIHVFFQDKKIHHLRFTTKTDGTLFPLNQISMEETFLNSYFWAESERPTSPQDIFSKPPRTPRKNVAAPDENKKKDKIGINEKNSRHDNHKH